MKLIGTPFIALFLMTPNFHLISLSEFNIFVICFDPLPKKGSLTLIYTILNICIVCVVLFCVMVSRRLFQFKTYDCIIQDTDRILCIKHFLPYVILYKKK